jgi:type IV secretory pathway VirB2 component (pilin)
MTAQHLHTPYKALMVAVMFVACCSMAASPANAAMASVLCSILNIVRYDLGKAVATMGVLSVAVGAALGKVSWGLAVTVAVGCSLMFNAGYYAGFFGLAGC